MANEEISDEQIESLKKNLIEQVNNNSEASEEQKQGFKEKIESMNKEEFVSFLKQQGIINESGEVNQGGSPANQDNPEQCIFCSIVDGKADSYILSNEENAMAVLDINPISQGQSLVIPKNHKQEIDEETKKLSEKVSAQIKDKLNPKEVKSEEQTIFGHKIISLIPIYDENTLKNERKKASKEELESLLEKLYLKQEKEENIQNEEANQEPITDQNTKLPKRIP